MLTDTEMPLLKQVYTSIHLDEAGLMTEVRNQGNYGVCWAFQTVAMLENAILLDKFKLNSGFWLGQVPNLHLSEAYVAINVRGATNITVGGMFLTVISFISQDPSFSTVELESDYPYAQMDTYLSKMPALLPPLISSANYMKPFRTFTFNPIDSPVVAVVYPQDTSFAKADIQQIKSYLSRGMAISVNLRARVASFLYYNGSTYTQDPCTQYGIDHTVTVVGYGTYHGREVWAVKNSWGTGWGAAGYFYTPIGEDNFCMEHSALAIVPTHYDPADGAYSYFGNQTRGNATQLDQDFGQLENNTGIISPMIMLQYYVLALGSSYLDAAQVLITDVTGAQVLTNTLSTLKFNVRQYRFPLQIQVTPSAPYYQTIETVSGSASNVIVNLPSQQVRYNKVLINVTTANTSAVNITVANSLGAALLTALSTLVNVSLPSSAYPLSVIVCSVGFLNKTLSGIQNAQNVTIQLDPARLVNVTVRANNVVYQGELNVAVTDSAGAIALLSTQSPAQTYLAPSQFPIGVTVSADGYESYSRANISDASNIIVDLVAKVNVVGIIVGSIIGVTVFAAAGIVLAAYLYKRHKKSKNQNKQPRRPRVVKPLQAFERPQGASGGELFSQSVSNSPEETLEQMMQAKQKSRKLKKKTDDGVIL